MKVIGEVREIYHDDSLPSIKELISDHEIEHKAEILEYLTSCRVTAVAPAIPTDVISGEIIGIGLKMHRDEKYAWRSDIAYYFDKYNLDLGNEFIEHVKAKKNLK